MMTTTSRTADYSIEPIFVDRWSTRAFDPVPISDTDLMSLFEAARWAPSAFNAQPWRFLYARRESEDWLRFMDVLVPFNRSWAQNASVVMLCLSETMMPTKPEETPKPSHSHSFDAGAAWAMLALQASKLGLAAHGMTGLDFDKAKSSLAIPDNLRIECAIVIGKAGDPAILPESLRAREVPSGRNPVTAFAFNGALTEGGEL